MAEVKRPRRYYLRERQQAVRAEEWDLSGVWRSKQQGQPGVALPASFPMLVQLAAQGYTTVEDLDGADEAELAANGEFSVRQAAEILAALAALLEDA